MNDVIHSTSNPLIQRLQKLHDKRHRDNAGQLLVEGEHLLQEAHRAGLLRQVLLLEQRNLPSSLTGLPCQYVSEAAMKRLSRTVQPAGLVGLVDRPLYPEQVYTRYLLLDGIQDPGNLGTLLRTALAFGVEAVILGPDCVDAWNDKVVRATQGAVFHLPIWRRNLSEAVSLLQERCVPVYAACLQGAVSLPACAKPVDGFALILGNEGQGIHPALLAQADIRVSIPLQAQVESLNVAVACGILLQAFDAHRAALQEPS